MTMATIDHSYIQILHLSARNYGSICKRFISLGNVVMAESNITKGELYPPNNALTVTALYNRNPRNLEKLRIAAKPSGWYLEKTGKCFWNKITLEMSSKCITSKVIHFNGYIPVTASTREWCIKKYLYSSRDSAAMEAVGAVVARRCIESGIFELYCNFSEEERKKPKIKIFIEALQEGGVVLTEPDNIYRADWPHHPRLMDRPWEFHEHPETGEITRETPGSTQCNTYNAVTKRPLH